MAFKTVEKFMDDRYRNMFRIQNDKETADVVFLYKSYRDMLVADVHYIKSAAYTGYVHCCGEGCPACAIRKPDGRQAIRPQTKIFIPLYNINKPVLDDDGNVIGTGAIEFWDKTMKFQPQFKADVFDKCPDPSEYVFKIIRHGLASDINTRYEIRAIGKNTVPGLSYDELLARFHAEFPAYYENIVKTVSISELTDMLQTREATNAPVTQEYVPIPRSGYSSSIPDTFVSAADAVGNSTELPDSDDPILSEFDDTTEVDGDGLATPNF